MVISHCIWHYTDNITLLYYCYTVTDSSSVFKCAVSGLNSTSDNETDRLGQDMTVSVEFIKMPLIDAHHSSIVSEADHIAFHLAKQHTAVCIWLLWGCSSDGLGQSLCDGLRSVCKEVHIPKPSPAGKHDTGENTHTTKRVQIIRIISFYSVSLTYTIQN